MKKEQLEKPEILEFLKLSRTLIRQVKQFRALEIQEKEQKLITDGLGMVKKEIDKYLEEK